MAHDSKLPDRRIESSFGELVRKLQQPRRADGPFAVSDPEPWEQPERGDSNTIVLSREEALTRASWAYDQGVDWGDGDGCDDTGGTFMD